MILKQPANAPCPVVFECDAAKQRALEAGVKLLRDSRHLPQPTCHETLRRHPIFDAVARHADAFRGGDSKYGRLAQVEQVAWTAVRLHDCLMELSPGEILRVCDRVGFAVAIDLKNHRGHRVTPGLVDVIAGPQDQTRLTCPLWPGPIVGLECLDSGEDFAAALSEVGIHEAPEVLDDFLDDGVRESLRSSAASQFSAKVIRRFRYGADNAN